MIFKHLLTSYGCVKMSFFNTQKELKNYMHIQGMHSFLNLGQNSVSIVGA